jgi:hypothetical protein
MHDHDVIDRFEALFHTPDAASKITKMMTYEHENGEHTARQSQTAAIPVGAYHRPRAAAHQDARAPGTVPLTTRTSRNIIPHMVLLDGNGQPFTVCRQRNGCRVAPGHTHTLPAHLCPKERSERRSTRKCRHCLVETIGWRISDCAQPTHSILSPRRPIDTGRWLRAAQRIDSECGRYDCSPPPDVTTYLGAVPVEPNNLLISIVANHQVAPRPKRHACRHVEPEVGQNHALAGPGMRRACCHIR